MNRTLHDEHDIKLKEIKCNNKCPLCCNDETLPIEMYEERARKQGYAECRADVEKRIGRLEIKSLLRKRTDKFEFDDYINKEELLQSIAKEKVK